MDIERLFWKLRLTCVLDRVLEVGCGTGALLRRLLDEGADAFGVDNATAALQVAARDLPGRTRLAGSGPLPFADGTFDTIVCRTTLTARSLEEIEDFARDIRRVARRHAALCVPAGAPGREWWDARFIAAGWRRHPALLRVVDYSTLDVESGPVLLLYEKIPDSALEAYPLRGLAAERDLHMDMLREPGRRSDAHMQRYAYAATLVRPNDVVLDVACGLGYGLAIMAAAGRAAKLIGIDNSAGAVEYARTMYAGAARDIECRQGDAHDLRAIPDGSVHLAVSFETLEHVARPDLFLSEIARVLAPGGRFVGSIPNEWLDDTGRDPNPHHLHVFDAERLLASFRAPFQVETLIAQTAGGGMKPIGAKGRAWHDVEPAAAAHEIAEWWIAVAMKQPVADRGECEDEVRAIGEELRAGRLALSSGLRAEALRDSDRINGREIVTAGTPRASVRGVGVFGSGSGALRVWEALAGCDGARVVWFADNDRARQGTTLRELDVIAPCDLYARGFDAIVIGSQSRAVIYDQLRSLGVERLRILAPDLDQCVDAIRADVASALAALDSAPVPER